MANEDEYIPKQTNELICGECGNAMSREHNAKWRELNYVCYTCNLGYRFEGVWDYSKEE